MQRPLTEHDLFPNGRLRRLGTKIHIAPELPSTNRFLLDAAGECSDGAIAWTELQTAGRGRLGRTWVAPRGSSILLSVLLREPSDSPLILHATTIAALAACEAIETETDCRPAVRWPNDLTLGGRKLGGVLAESTRWPNAANGERALVIGIGVNCLQHAGHFDESLKSKATSLDIESTTPIDRPRIAAAILRSFDTFITMDAPPGAREQKWRSGWLARCEDLGARVTLQENGREFRGTVVEIAETGDLAVQLDEGVRRNFAAGTTTRTW